ncbi:hypothetical protein PRUPE_4G196800 [Prunus persica]|uniref:Uncharacterized protein n=1 Tax=Prunus persica TaxID=3760 RepID=A0A251PN43_PRUPE|nr:hypothetical protein PRUPE_4G196800 [Prunus persica]
MQRTNRDRIMTPTTQLLTPCSLTAHLPTTTTQLRFLLKEGWTSLNNGLITVMKYDFLSHPHHHHHLAYQ